MRAGGGVRELDLLVRGAAIGVMLPLAWSLWRQRPGTLPGALGPLNALGLGCYLLWGSPAARSWPATVQTLLVLGALCQPFLFWWLVHLIFSDRFRARAMHLLLLPAVLVPGLIVQLGRDTVPGWLWSAAGHLFRLAALGLVLHLLARVLGGWRGDLVETRRRLRGPLLLGVALISILTLAIFLYAAGPQQRAWLRLPEALLFFGLLVLLATRAGPAPDGLLRPEPISPPSAPVDGDIPAAAAVAEEPWQPVLLRLQREMRDGELWRETGLSIGMLADRVGVPEYRLRRLINQHLGHRNFIAYLNEHRLPATAAALADPALRRLPVLTIALDHGFGSIGPFNRAFRERYGMTPTEYRRRAETALQPA